MFVIVVSLIRIVRFVTIVTYKGIIEALLVTHVI